MNNHKCRICGSDRYFKLTDFGSLPIAHHLPGSPDPCEYRHPFVLMICETCGIAGIADPCPPENLYLDFNYNFSSWKSEPHMEDEVDMIIRGFGRPPGCIFEIGCNDGSFMAVFDDSKTPLRIGMEPNPFPAALAEKKGIKIVNEFLSIGAIDNIVRKNGCFDLVVARQVLEHLHDPELFFECLDRLVSDEGLVFIDVPDSENAFCQGDCSVLWDEHVSYFCENSLIRLFMTKGFEPIDLKKFNFSGGILSCLFKRTQTRNNSCIETADISSFVKASRAYPEKIDKYRTRLSSLIETGRNHGFVTALYGVGCRGTMLVNCLDMGGVIDLALDDQAERQGKYVPGTELEIMKSEVLAGYDRVLVILAVSQENDDRVKKRISAITGHGDIVVVSACSPAPIFREIHQALSKFDL